MAHGPAQAISNHLLSATAHELKTPLSLIRAIAVAASSGTYGVIGLELKQQLSRVEITSDRLLSIIDGLLGMEKVRAGRAELMFEPIQIFDLANTVVEELQILIKEKSQSISIESKSQMPLAMVSRLFGYQILYNLLHNAIKYSPPGSTIKVQLVSGSNSIKISVTDQAPKLKASDQNQLFSSFSPLSQKANSLGGSGLGLFISKNMAELIGGALRCRPGSGGNIFLLEMPITQQMLLFRDQISSP